MASLPMPSTEPVSAESGRADSGKRRYDCQIDSKPLSSHSLGIDANHVVSCVG